MTALNIDWAGDWRAYWGPKPLPGSWEPMGTVTDRGTGETGAFLCVPSSYRFVRGNGGKATALSRHQVNEALAAARQTAPNSREPEPWLQDPGTHPLRAKP